MQLSITNCAPAHIESAYLADMCHEIRTPLTAILGISEILLSSQCPPQKHDQCVEVLRDSATMLKEMIDDMLDNSRIEADMMKLEHLPFDLAKSILEAVHIVTPKAEEKGLNLCVYIGEIPQFLIGDSLRIKQIVLNLLANAIKFTDVGYVRLDVRAEVDINQGWRIRISVTDTGIGIPLEAQDRIFDKYAQAEISTSRRYGGSGLGLTICQKLAQMMGGDIMVESQLGKGSCFTASLRLPEAMMPMSIAA